MKTGILCAALAASLSVSATLPAYAQGQPMASDKATQNLATKSPSKMTHAPLAKGKNSFTQKQAQERLEKAGYTQVTDLALDADGLWQARAMHHGQWVNAAVDYKGNVAAR